MVSILGRLLCKELGEQKYNIYFECFCKEKNQNEKIFCDIYKQLKNRDLESLHLMMERLKNAIELSMRISKQYIWVWLMTVLTIILLIIMPLSFLFTLIGICIVITAFGYKSMVFMINRYCFIDAGIILIYRLALYHLILSYTVRNIKTDVC